MRWIKSRTPPDLEPVLLCHAFKKIDGSADFVIFVGYWDRLNRCYTCAWVTMLTPSGYEEREEEFELKRSQVIGWMKLPQPPEEVMLMCLAGGNVTGSQSVDPVLST